jgi:nucleoside-diphosphate-sugar epimerase
MVAPALEKSEMKRIVVTGSSGMIGRFLLDAWRESGRYDVVGLARSEGEYTDVLTDTDDMDALVKAFQGADAIVHLAGSAAVDSSWDDVLESNIIGLRNVFEAARIAGVPRVVFSSSNHAVGTFEEANAPDIWEIHDTRQIDHTSELMPDSYYGVSKA